MTHKKAINTIRQNFEAQLEEKTSWGRNELKSMFERVISDFYIGKADRDIENSPLKKRVKTTVKTETFLPSAVKRKRRR